MLVRSSRSWFAGCVLFGGALLAFGGCAGRSTKERESDRASSGASAGSSATGGAGGSGATNGSKGGTKATGAGGAGGTGAVGTGGTRGGTGGTMAGGAGGSGGTGGNAAGTAGAPDSYCVIARRLDQCCSQPMPVSAPEYEANPCWSLWDPVTPAAPRPGCTVSTCAAACPRFELPSREVAPTPGGTCEFSSECETADDCVLLWDSHTNCACDVQPLPRSYEGQCCWVLPTDPPPPGCGTGQVACNCTSQPPLYCAPTPANGGRCISEQLTHPEQGLLNRDDRCVAEKQCPTSGVGPCPTCYAPGRMACGGPAPPPATCATDADCTTATNLICDVPPCGNKQCIAGCIADSDCAPSEVCGSDHRCAPAPCTGDSDCHPNRRCDSDGHCVRRSCTLSSECCTASDCGGYCVDNLCYEVPGTCQDACAP